MDIRQVRASLSVAATQKAAQQAAQQEAESRQRAKKPKKAAKQVSEPEYAFLDPQSDEVVWQRMAEDEGYEESEAERNVREEYSGGRDGGEVAMRRYTQHFAGRVLQVADYFPPHRAASQVPIERSITDVEHLNDEAFSVYPNVNALADDELARNLTAAIHHNFALYGAEYVYDSSALRTPPPPPATRTAGPTKTQRVFIWITFGSIAVTLLSTVFMAYLRTRGAA